MSTTLDQKKATIPFMRRIALVLLEAQIELDSPTRRELFCMVGNLAEHRYMEEVWRLGRSVERDPKEYSLS